ncbi:hypothetical protein MKK63_11370 [Methylobacterium sp. J-088]|uniref:hypothetical protein n=1 Tax=Methylobacterium sp. J-088 TaxID=2836664 RepID=UPI001FBBFC5B|nr:hypothetical protein [Methylobacterium sp. J-088]MCJ2063309.1 hypothetical protein [Methylobacterium sp. J-088]
MIQKASLLCAASLMHLEKPLENFFQDAPPADETHLLELLHLWNCITDPRARNRLLSVARREAAEQAWIEDFL